MRSTLNSMPVGGVFSSAHRWCEMPVAVAPLLTPDRIPQACSPRSPRARSPSSPSRWATSGGARTARAAPSHPRSPSPWGWPLPSAVTTNPYRRTNPSIVRPLIYLARPHPKGVTARWKWPPKIDDLVFPGGLVGARECGSEAGRGGERGRESNLSAPYTLNPEP
jgi:hypothetical protein